MWQYPHLTLPSSHLLALKLKCYKTLMEDSFFRYHICYAGGCCVYIWNGIRLTTSQVWIPQKLSLISFFSSHLSLFFSFVMRQSLLRFTSSFYAPRARKTPWYGKHSLVRWNNHKSMRHLVCQLFSPDSHWVFKLQEMKQPHLRNLRKGCAQQRL